MSFGEFMFLAGFIQKTVKVNQIFKVNCAYLEQKLLQKVLEDSRRHHTEAEGEAPLAPPTGRPAPRAHLSAPCFYVGSPPPPRLHLCRLFKSV